ncbi:MAG TPA: hypothetical protein VGC53_11505 [Vicinamibacteria bacterium]|jgi:hypothetical protein
MHGWVARSPLVTVLLVVLLAGLTNWLYSSNVLKETTILSPQSQANRRFVNRESLDEALERYRNTWTPLYPMALRMAGDVGIPLRRVNQLLFYVTLAWMLWFVRRRLPDIHWWWPLLLFSLASFNYSNMYQYVPEILFVPLSLLVFSALLGYLERPSIPTLAALSLGCAAACLTKYIGLFWLVPIGAAHVLLADPSAGRRRILHACAFCLISVLPVGLWMGYQYRRTGYLTGIDRFEPRAPSAELGELTSFGSNLWLTMKTALVDFFSIFQNADHATINHAYRPDWTQYAFAGTTLAIVLVNRGLFRRLFDGGRHDWRKIAGGLAVGYVVVLIALWTVGNNDPIYTRFVYPVYPFLVLLGFAAYSAARAREGVAWWMRAPFWALYGLLLLVHVHKTVILHQVVHTGAWS